MPNTLKGVKVKGQQYHFDHEYLDNNPIPAYDTDTEGFVLVAHECNLEWSSIDNVLDSSSASTGDVLMATGQGIAWRSVSGFPTYDTTYPSSDEGKVLSVNDYGELIWETPDGSLPEIPTSSTVFSPLVLTVNDGTIEWGQINDILCVGGSDGVLTYRSGEIIWSNVLPGYDENDAGKVLTVNNAGELVWAMPS